MKRSEIWLILTFLLVLGCYALWGLRPFVLRPPLYFEKGIPSEAQEVVRRWHETNDVFETGTFEWKRYIDALCLRCKNAASPVAVSRIGNKTLIAAQQSSRSTKPTGFVRITRKSKDWSATRVDEVPWGSISLMAEKITARQKRMMNSPIPDGIPTE